MLQNIPNEKVLEIVRQGPTFPSKVAKALGGGGDTMLIGAILSTLIGSGDLKVSTLKVGGSPLYYVPEQESKLEDFLSYLNEKDKRTFKLLKEEKVLLDSNQDPLTRVSLRVIKDFAKMFEFEHKGQKLLCWRFYSVSVDEAQLLAKKIASKPFVVEESEPGQEVEQTKVVHSETKHEHKASLIIEPKPVVEAPIEKSVALEKHITEKHLEHEDVIQQVLEESEQLSHNELKHDESKHEHKTEHQVHEKHEHSKPVKEPKASKVPKAPKVKEPKIPKAPKLDYNFFELILNHVSSMKLDVISKEKVKKTEYDLVLKNHENNEYIYCKAKDKPTISEGDLAPALIFAQNKKMPCLFLSTGELTKTAGILITREFSGLKFEKINIVPKENN